MKMRFFCPVHREGWLFLFIAIVATLLIWQVSEILGTVGVIISIWCAYFFRDPSRVTPNQQGLIVAPADGTLLPIQEVVPPKELNLGENAHYKISIFMDVLNVHINRAPANGTIESMHYHKGKFFNASLDKASEHNERKLYTLRMDNEDRIGFVQIAGLVARRIRCWTEEGAIMKAGERFGMICFGSRVDVYLPKQYDLHILAGQTTIAGETVLASRDMA